MKKHLFTALLIVLTLSGCSKDLTTKTPDEPEPLQEEEQVQNTSDQSLDSNIIREDFLDRSANNYSYTKETYTFTVMDNNRATLTHYVLSNSYDETTNYYGTYITNGDLTKFSYSDDGYYYVLKYEDDKLVAVSNLQYEDELPEDRVYGTFTALDNYYGLMELTLEDYSFATLKTKRGTIFYGKVISYLGDYDLMASADDNSDNLDWILYFNEEDHTFTYQPYGEDDYEDGDYEDGEEIQFGEFPLYGDFGGFNLYIDEDYNASAWVPIEGNDIYFTGSVDYDYDTGFPAWAYLNSEDSHYSLSLELNYIESDYIWNYSGTITTSLSAG